MARKASNRLKLDRTRERHRERKKEMGRSVECDSSTQWIMSFILHGLIREEEVCGSQFDIGGLFCDTDKMRRAMGGDTHTHT